LDITIYHNPSCSTSRSVLQAIRAAGHEPHIVEYLKTPLSSEAIAALAASMNAPLRTLVRTKEPLFRELVDKRKQLHATRRELAQPHRDAAA